MSKNDKKFVKVPQVEIDGETFHESALVSFGVVKDSQPYELDGNQYNKVTWTLKKYVIVRDKIREEKDLRSEEGPQGREIIKNQMEIEVRKEIKRLEGEV